ncbi:MAG: DUF2254 domain-containing protein [Actinobacteria bacterium]|uniref:Unannotated protein n=1 Tax=freshwater metagenome TaxID=449393 RepID=A0A6J7U6C2_9ZZZZ|nr:DUF2254 domain-containing protein [Actinomycetota bacterium]MTA73292.1 DUF2254 domain-containing protein [Actinomycetota bacterium]
MTTSRRSLRARSSTWWWEISYRVGPNLWVTPLLMSIGSVLLFAFSVWVDRHVDLLSSWFPSALIDDSASDAAILVTALLGAVATALALVFSTSILTFSLASTQLGPRLIRRFMKDPITQITLGAFLGTVIFNVLTLSAIRSSPGSQLPAFSVFLVEVLSLCCFGLLVFYVHRVASTIQAPAVVAAVVADLGKVLAERSASMRVLLREHDPEKVSAAVTQSRESGAPIAAIQTGYVELVDVERLLEAADSADAVIVLNRRPGQFTQQGQILAWVSPSSADDRLQQVVAQAVEIGRYRTLRQDLEFAIAQVVEIALRALSPAINDTYTGLTCVDWLGAAMVQVGTNPERTGGISSADGTLRLVIPPLKFDRVLKTAFDLIRQSAAHNVAVLIRILDAISAMAPVVRPEHLAPLRKHADLVAETARAGSFVSGDLEDIEQRYSLTVTCLDLAAQTAQTALTAQEAAS